MDTVIISKDEYRAMVEINKEYLAKNTVILNGNDLVVKSLSKKGMISAYTPGRYTPTMLWVSGNFDVDVDGVVMMSFEYSAMLRESAETTSVEVAADQWFTAAQVAELAGGVRREYIAKERRNGQFGKEGEGWRWHGSQIEYKPSIVRAWLNNPRRGSRSK